ncbi:MAG: HAMP domain-containing histidine kinase [Candidatus Tectomicrobia bacterium]|nr:HAMP domain-containing histidine kinase [Candidatus Tectomicrobia bacterium]
MSTNAQCLVSIRTKMLRTVIPLVAVPILLLGLGWFATSKLEESTKNERFFQQRSQDLIAISEIPSIQNFFINLGYGPEFLPEADRFRREIERYNERFFVRNQLFKGTLYKDISLIVLIRDSNGMIVQWKEALRSTAQELSANPTAIIPSNTYLQSALQSGPGKVSFSALAPIMHAVIPIYRDENFDGLNSPAELKGILTSSFTYPMAEFQHIRKMASLTIVSILFASLLIAVIIVSFVIGKITEPINHLAEATQRIANGQLSLTLDVKTNDEIGALAHDFSKMTLELSRSITAKEHYAAELQALNTELDIHVHQRTEELREANKKLQLANRELEEADRMKSEFLANVSHEIRTPLTIIRSSVYNLLLGIGGPPSEKQQKYLKTVENNIHRLTSFVNDLLDLERIRAGFVQFTLRPVLTCNLVEVVLDNLVAQAAEKNITLNYERTNPPIVAYADRDQTIQVLTNLVENAIKFTPQNGSIVLKTYYENGSCVLMVQDSGEGIPERDLPFIFDRFYRVQRGTAAKGSGLGLSICKRLVELQGGQIQVQSSPGAGTTFFVTFASYTQ